MNRFSILILLFLTVLCIGQNDKKTEINTYINTGFRFYPSSIDSVYSYLGKAKKIGKEYHDIASLCTIYNVESWFASTYGDLSKMKSNIDSLQILISNNDKIFQSLPDRAFYESQTVYTKGMYNFMLKDFEKARIHFDYIIEITEGVPDTVLVGDFFDILIETNNYQNAMFVREGKYSLAESFLDNNLRLIGSNNKNLASRCSTLSHLANIYSEKGEYEKANRTIQKCLPYYKTLEGSANRLITSYHRIVENHIDLNQLDSAKFYLAKIKKVLDIDNPFVYRYHNVSASISENEGNYDIALASLRKSLEFFKKKWKDQPHTEIGTAYQNIGKLSHKSEKIEDALLSYANALSQLSIENESSTIERTLRFEILKNITASQNINQDFDETTRVVNEAIITLNNLKPTFRTQQDKLFLIENAYPLFENALEAAYQRYQQSQDDSLIDTAFYYSEKSKSTLLLEALLSAKASTYANIPEDLLEKEKQLKARISNLEKRINSKSTSKLEDELFDTNGEYRNLLKRLENDFPKYYDLKYSTEVVSLKTIQNQQDNDDALLSYFYGNEAIYVVLITKNAKDFIKIPITDQLESSIKTNLTLLKDPTSDLKQLHRVSNELYSVLLNKLELPSQTHLTIMTDGLLNYIPFGSLSMDGQHKYFIEEYAISYASSATLLQTLEAKKDTNHQLLGFAPSFNSANSSNLLPLPKNEFEVASALRHFAGQAFQDESASLPSFYSESENYGIIHLATHAVYNDQDPEFSYLAFTQNETDDHLLYANDLYNLNLNADLVTLSACDSGVGELRRGEGLMSLARGFYYGGARSIASTLWKINDNPSSGIMDSFYRELSGGVSKSKALQEAQLSFIRKNKDNALSHPYHWAGFIISGNTAPIVALDYTFWYAFGAILLILAIVFFLKIRKKNRLS